MGLTAAGISQANDTHTRVIDLYEWPPTLHLSQFNVRVCIAEKNPPGKHGAIGPAANQL
jgi:hypothetical protein